MSNEPVDPSSQANQLATYIAASEGSEAANQVAKDWEREIKFRLQSEISRKQREQGIESESRTIRAGTLLEESIPALERKLQHVSGKKPYTPAEHLYYRLSQSFRERYDYYLVFKMLDAILPGDFSPNKLEQLVLANIKGKAVGADYLGSPEQQQQFLISVRISGIGDPFGLWPEIQTFKDRHAKEWADNKMKFEQLGKAEVREACKKVMMQALLPSYFSGNFNLARQLKKESLDVGFTFPLIRKLDEAEDRIANLPDLTLREEYERGLRVEDETLLEELLRREHPELRLSPSQLLAVESTEYAAELNTLMVMLKRGRYWRKAAVKGADKTHLAALAPPAEQETALTDSEEKGGEKTAAQLEKIMEATQDLPLKNEGKNNSVKRRRQDQTRNLLTQRAKEIIDNGINDSLTSEVDLVRRTFPSAKTRTITNNAYKTLGHELKPYLEAIILILKED